MDALSLIVGGVLLTIGTVFAIAIGVLSSSDEKNREKMAGGG